MRLLLVEDKDSFRRLLAQALEGSAWTVAAAADPLEALRLLEADPVQLMVTDLRLPGMTGLELIRRARQVQPSLRMVLMSAFAEPRDIVEAMRLGADDFLAKPFDLDAFLALLDRLGALVGAPPPDPTEPWVAHSGPMKALDKALGKAASTTLPVLIRGDQGSGRARSARRLHTLRNPALPYRSLPASELGPAGPEPGLLELLRGGSLYVAGLEQLSPQAAGPLAQAMTSPAGQPLTWMGGIASDAALPPELAHRLDALELRVPPLRDRREDILALARLLLERGARRLGRTAPWLERAAERQLLDHRWPGNVQELEEVVERTLLASPSPAIRGFPDLGLENRPLCLPWPEAGSLEAMLRTIAHSAERDLLQRALLQARGSLPRTAEHLGVSLRVLTQRLRDQGIPLEDGSAPPTGMTP